MATVARRRRGHQGVIGDGVEFQVLLGRDREDDDEHYHDDHARDSDDVDRPPCNEDDPRWLEIRDCVHHEAERVVRRSFCVWPLWLCCGLGAALIALAVVLGVVLPRPPIGTGDPGVPPGLEDDLKDFIREVIANTTQDTLVSIVDTEPCVGDCDGACPAGLGGVRLTTCLDLDGSLNCTEGVDTIVSESVLCTPPDLDLVTQVAPCNGTCGGECEGDVGGLLFTTCLDTDNSQTCDQGTDAQYARYTACAPYNPVPALSQVGCDVYLEGNLHVRDGSGSTAFPNERCCDAERAPAHAGDVCVSDAQCGGVVGACVGKGNVILGYNEDLAPAADKRSGSHNFVTGEDNEWRAHSGLLAGESLRVTAARSIATGLSNTVDGANSAAVAGSSNLVSTAGSGALASFDSVVSGPNGVVVGGNDLVNAGELSVMVGGEHNDVLAGAFAATVTGGDFNEVGATSQWDSIVGGMDNTVETDGNSVVIGGVNLQVGPGAGSAAVGGRNNVVSGEFSSTFGGDRLTLAGDDSDMSGGFNNTIEASVPFDAYLSGGVSNRIRDSYAGVIVGAQWAVVSANHSMVSGGALGRAEGERSTVFGGYNGIATGIGSSVFGGDRGRSTGTFDSATFGGYQARASGQFSAVVGGRFNVASAAGAVVSGGESNTASAAFAKVVGGLTTTIAAPYEIGPDPALEAAPWDGS